MKTKMVMVGEWIPATKVLNAIVGLDGISVEALYTNPDTNRDLVTIADRHGIDVVDIRKLKKNDLTDLGGREVDWLLSVNSTVILSPTVLELPRVGALNMHPGKLPEYAGLHTHQWAIRNGETEFGATLHWMEPGVDTGPVAYQETFPLRHTHTGLSLFMETLKVGTELVLRCLETIARGEMPPRIPQDLSRRHLYKHKDALDGRLPIEGPAQVVIDFVRAADYGPLASPTYVPTLAVPEGSLHVHRVVRSADPAGAPPGTVVGLGSEGVRLAVGENESVLITVASVPGEKGRLKGEAIVAALGLSVGDRLGSRDPG